MHKLATGVLLGLSAVAIAGGVHLIGLPTRSRQAPDGPARGDALVRAPAVAADAARSTGTRARSQGLPWSAHFGSQDEARPWATAVRGVGRGITGVPPGARNTTAVKLATANLPQLVAGIQAAGQRDVMLPIGGLGSARVEEDVKAYFDFVRADRAAAWKNVVYQQARAVAQGDAQAGTIYWQVGNEINSAYWATSVGNGSGLARRFNRNNTSYTPVYVEEYLAPSVEALRRAAADANPGDRPLKIVLGSLANAGRSGAIEWLEQLLNYRIRGDDAPSLAGKLVYQVVDVMSYHYLVTANDDTWRQQLDQLAKDWIDSGKLSGMFATEELGRRRPNAGYGGSTALAVAGRYLDWWAGNGLTPDQSRCFFWGWELGDPGNRGTDALDLIYDFLQDSPIEPFTRSVDGRGAPELYAFSASSDPSKRVVIMYFPDGPDRWTRAVRLKASGWSGPAHAVVHVFGPRGQQVDSVQVKPSGGVYEIDVPESAWLEPGTGILITVQRETA